MSNGHEKLEYNEITSNIYIGTNMCCQTHFEEELLKKGLSADISLEEDRLDAPFGVKYYLWLPTKDQAPPTQEQLKIGVRNIDEMINLGKKIYVHCKNGHGRAPTLVAAYFISKGAGVEEAIQKIKEKRPSVHLQESQIEALREYKKSFTL